MRGNIGAVQLEAKKTKDYMKAGAKIIIPESTGVNAYAIGIPVSLLDSGAGEETLTVSTQLGQLTIPDNMLAGVSGITGSMADVTIGHGNKENLPEDVKSALGDRPIIQLTLSIDGKQVDWSNPNAAITISMPYTPTEEELKNPDSIVVWYIDGSGNVVTVPNGRYDAATGTVVFSVTHFSQYAVAYVKKTFADLAQAWNNQATSACLRARQVRRQIKDCPICRKQRCSCCKRRIDYRQQRHGKSYQQYNKGGSGRLYLQVV